MLINRLLYNMITNIVEPENTTIHSVLYDFIDMAWLSEHNVRHWSSYCYILQLYSIIYL